MAKCEICGKRIERNEYKIVKGKVYCQKCWEKSMPTKNVDAEEVKAITIEEIAAREIKEEAEAKIVISTKDVEEEKPKPKKPRKRKYKKRN